MLIPYIAILKQLVTLTVCILGYQYAFPGSSACLCGSMAMLYVGVPVYVFNPFKSPM